jgi:hypothetical protein
MKLLGGACLFVCLFASVAASTDPQPSPQPVTPPAPPPGETLPDWPAAPVVPQPMPPQPAPKAVANLAVDELYVVQSDDDVQLLASPPGVVTVTKEQVPLKIRGLFVGNKIVSTRTYTKKNVFIVERVKPGDVELLLVPAGKVERRTVGDGGEPIPPPKPKPDPEPKPDGLGLKAASKAGLAKVADQAGRVELAKQQRAHASAVAAGAFDSPAAILAGWRAANNRAEPDLTKLAAFQARWKPWAADVSAKLSQLYAAGRLTKNSDWAAAFNEIADGLGG